MFRKIVLLTIILAALILLTGCNLKKKIGDSITEGIVDKAIGDEGDIDIEDGEINIKGEDGETMTIDEDGIVYEGEDGAVMQSGGVYDWPEGMAADYIPKYKDAKVTYILNMKDTCMLCTDENKLEDYEDYVEKVKDEGFTENTYESSSDDMKSYTASTKDGLTIVVSFISSDGSLDITLDASQKQ